MDVMLYSLVLAHLMADLGMDKRTGGLLNSLTLFASALGARDHSASTPMTAIRRQRSTIFSTPALPRNPSPVGKG